MVKVRSKDILQPVCYKIHGLGHLLKHDVLKALRKVVRSRERSEYPLRVGLGLIVKYTRKKPPPVVRSLLAVVLAGHSVRKRIVNLLPGEEVVGSLGYDVEWKVTVLGRSRKMAEKPDYVAAADATKLGIIILYSPTLWLHLFHKTKRRGDGMREKGY